MDRGSNGSLHMKAYVRRSGSPARPFHPGTVVEGEKRSGPLFQLLRTPDGQTSYSTSNSGNAANSLSRNNRSHGGSHSNGVSSRNSSSSSSSPTSPAAPNQLLGAYVPAPGVPSRTNGTIERSRSRQPGVARVHSNGGRGQSNSAGGSRDRLASNGTSVQQTNFGSQPGFFSGRKKAPNAQGNFSSVQSKVFAIQSMGTSGHWKGLRYDEPPRLKKVRRKRTKV